jgi:hypothetical protein
LCSAALLGIALLVVVVIAFFAVLFTGRCGVGECAFKIAATSLRHMTF